MSLSNLLQKNDYDIYSNKIESPTGIIDNLSVTLINGLPPPSAPPILAPVNSILTVTSPGIASFIDNAILNDLNITGNIEIDSNSGLVNQYIKKTSTTTQDWDYINVDDITPGTAYQVVETDLTGNNVQWTSTLGIDSLTFTGNIANFQSVFNRYYTSSIQLPLYAVTQGGTPSIFQNINVNGYFSIIGKRVELTIFPFTLSSLFGGATAPCYLSFLIAPSYLRAANLLGIGNEENRQSTCMCSISQNASTQQQPAFANVYYNYYATNACYIELIKGNAGNFASNSYHGEPFVTAGIEFMELKAPFTISYICQ